MSSQELISVLLFLLAILTICGLEIAILVRSIGNRLRGLFARKILFAKPSIVVHGIALSIFACLLYAYFIEPCWIDMHSATLHTARLKSDSFRIVQISDLHCDRTARNEERVVQIINGLKPDIVVATGDYLNDLAGLPRLRQMLSRLDAPLGRFAVTGNFEAFHWPNVDVLADSGFRVLERETVVVTKGADALAITGMGFVRSDSPRGPFEGFSEDRYDVFLFHTPDLVEDFANRGIDLYLCGHTHGGQVRLPWYGALVTLSKFGKKYESGLYRVGDTVLYVNRGLGLEPRPAPQVRFLARPEIAVFDILPE
ncbi:MAG: metallophosphoesterase [Phycisphaerales bacterium]